MRSISGNHGAQFSGIQSVSATPSSASSVPEEAKQDLGECLAPDQLHASSWNGQSRSDDALIKIYGTYGTEKQVMLRGRVLLDKHPSQPKASDSFFTNFIRNFGFLDSEEIRHAEVDVRFAGQTVRATTDRDGLFEIKLDLDQPLAPGFHKVEAQLIPDPDNPLKIAPAKGLVVIQRTDDQSFGVISDIDDTVQYTHVSNKLDAVKTLLLGNETTLKEVPGMAALYKALDQANDGCIDGDVSYLSGSPMNYVDRIEHFLNMHDFPQGPIQLKNFGFRKGEDNPFKQTDYKLNHLREMFETYPQKSFILFGDSGEQDPEIYAQIAREYPDQIEAVVINHMSSEALDDPRFAGMIVINNGLDAAVALHQKGILPDVGLAAVRQAMPK